MTSPAIVSAGQKAVIGPRAALLSTLRLWLLYRDEALWAFVSGAETDKPLDEIQVNSDVLAHVADVNQIGERAWKLAAQIAAEKEQKPATIMREAINELLSTEQPRFLLAVPHVTGTF
jgi:hypothetical protein